MNIKSSEEAARKVNAEFNEQAAISGSLSYKECNSRKHIAS